MMEKALTLRGPALPADAKPYRALGPFDAASIPKGLWKEHSLKPEVWALLRVEQGSIRFCWDDAEGGSTLLNQDDSLIVPPLIPHHLEEIGPVTIRLTFWAVPE